MDMNEIPRSLFSNRPEMLNEKYMSVFSLPMNVISRYHVKYPIMDKIHQQLNHTKVHWTSEYWQKEKHVSTSTDWAIIIKFKLINLLKTTCAILVAIQ